MSFINSKKFPQYFHIDIIIKFSVSCLPLSLRLDSVEYQCKNISSNNFFIQILEVIMKASYKNQALGIISKIINKLMANELHDMKHERM